MSADLNWNDLRFLLAISRTGTLASAARELGVNYTTVSRRIQTLQEELGTQLVERTPDGHRLTEAGQRVSEVATDIEDKLHRLDLAMLATDHMMEGDLSVSMPDMFIKYLSPLFASFCEQYPSITLHIDTSNHIVDLSRREADIALRVTQQPSPQLFGRKLAHMAFGAYASREYLKRFEKNAYPQMSWLCFATEYKPILTEQWLDTHAAGANIHRFHSTVGLFESIIGGMGAAFIPVLFGELEPTLQRLRPPEPGFGMDLWLLTHPDLKQNKRVRTLMEEIAREFEEKRGLLEGTQLLQDD